MKNALQLSLKQLEIDHYQTGLLIGEMHEALGTYEGGELYDAIGKLFVKYGFQIP